MLKRTYLGLEVRSDGLRSIAVQRARGGVALLGGQTLQLGEGILRLEAQEPNICQPDQFIEAVREVLLPLSRRENRIALALPDTIGHIFLLDIETPFKKAQEGEEVIRWHLKDRLPTNNRTISMAYQVLEERESGSKRLLVSVIAKDVLRQYEEVLAKAGFGAAVVDFHSLNIYNAYRTRVDLGTDFVVASVDDNHLSLLAFENLKLNFYRSKTVSMDADSVFQELNRSLVGYRRSHSTFARASIFLHCNWTRTDDLREAVQAAFEREIELLPSPLLQLVNSGKLAISAAEANSMAAALGIAERMIPRVRG